MPRFSVIVLNWNGKHFLQACLQSLRRQTYADFETILVDNGSQDGSAEYVRSHYPEVQLLVLDENRGFCGGNLAGYEAAQGEIIVLLNNDTETSPHWLMALDEAAERFPHAGSFACKMLYFDERNRLDNCGYELTLGGYSIDIGRDQLDGPQYSSYRPVWGGCGGAVAYRRAMLEDIGFFDPDFFMTYEDLDLSCRAQLRGYDCMFVPQAVVYHRYRATMTGYPARQAFLSQRNIEFVYLKNVPATLLLRGLGSRLLYFVGSAIYFTVRGAGLPFARAKLAAAAALPKLWRKRRQIQRGRRISATEFRGKMVGGIRDRMTKLYGTLQAALSKF